MIHAQPSWRELYRTSDASMAQTVATCIEGMEFEVRLRDALGREIDTPNDDGSEAHEQHTPPFVIEVHASDWPALRDVLNDLIAEQREFDAKLEADRRRSMRVAQLLILSTAALLASVVGATALKQCEASKP